MTLDLTDEQQQALAAYLRKALDAEKYRLSPGRAPIKEVLAMLDPPREAKTTSPPPSYAGPTRASTIRKRTIKRSA
jgi:hypothetical protein